MVQENALREGIVTEDMLSPLPEPVQRYMRWTGVVGRPWIRTAYVRQAGKFRLAADKPWMPMKAEQLYTTQPLAMKWRARFKMFGLPLFAANDSYRDGEGHMFGKAAGLFSIFDARGEKIDLGTLTRILSEMIWFPIAYLGENVTWTAVDDHSADVALTDHDHTASGRMFFDEQGRFVTFEAMRYKEDNGQYTWLPWHTPASEWGMRGGLNIPTRGEVYWLMPEGKLTYGDFNIVEAAYNRPGDAI